MYTDFSWCFCIVLRGPCADCKTLKSSYQLTYLAELVVVVVVVVVCAGWFLAQPSWWCRVRCQILGYPAQLLVAAACVCVCVCIWVFEYVSVTMFFWVFCVCVCVCVCVSVCVCV